MQESPQGQLFRQVLQHGPFESPSQAVVVAVPAARHATHAAAQAIRLMNPTRRG